jgi:hypothetical protein
MALEERDRDIVIKIEQQLQNAAQNQVQILEDLRTIFNRLEQESKTIMIISGDLKAHLESSVLRWNNIDRQIVDIMNRVSLTEDKVDNLSEAISNEREERIEGDTSVQKENTEKYQESENFKREVKASVSTTGWIFGILATVATIISTVALFIHH